MKLIKRNLWPFLIVGLTMLTGLVFKAGLKKTWQKVNKKGPPDNPERTDVTWKETVAWTAVSGLITAFSKLLVKQTTRWAKEKS